MIDGLVGALNGDTKLITVRFPVRPSGPGAALSGKEALFEVDVLAGEIT
jgi:FKBP-type peptidyl-prolyl cis-trans isomerase (trigger factor)